MATKAKDNYTFANHSAVPSHIMQPFVQLFKSWDMPESDDKYLDSWFPDGELVFGAVSKGRPQVKAARESMVHATKGPIVDLQHDLQKFFVLAGGDLDSAEVEIIMTGEIWYLLKNGKKIDRAWASRAQIAKDHQGDGKIRIKHYEVYLDSLPLVNAINEMNAQETNGTNGH